MIQRFVKSALDRGLADFAQQGRIAYQELFGDIWYLSASEVDGIFSYFSKHPVKTHLGYPRSAIAPDCVSLYIMENSQSQPGFAVGDQGGSAQVVTPGGQVVVGAPIASSLWDHMLSVMVLSFQQEIAVYAVEICKAIMLAAKDYFISVAVELPVMSVSEVQPASQYEPENLWMRNLSLRCRREFSVVNTSQSLRRAFKIDGVFGPIGSGNDYGSVPHSLQVEVPRP